MIFLMFYDICNKIKIRDVNSNEYKMQVMAINNNPGPNFRQRFRLNENVKKIIAENSGKTIEELKTQRLHITEENIIPYTKGDVLIPRNVYLQTGRKEKSSEIKNAIDNWCETPISRFRKWCNMFISNK